MSTLARLIAPAFALAFAIASLLSCATRAARDPRSFEAAPLYGMIYDLGNRPVGNALLAVDGKESASSDVTGRFFLPHLARGEHVIAARKQGYELLTVKLSFLDDTQVLYLQMCSQEQLLALAEITIEEQEWAEARSYLARAATIDEENPIYRFVTAILDERQRRPQEAEKTLRSLLARGYTEPAVYLFLADLHQYELEQPAAAVEELRRYLELRSDSAVQKRLDALEERGD